MSMRLGIRSLLRSGEIRLNLERPPIVSAAATRRQLLLGALCVSLLAGWSILVVSNIVLRRDTFHWDESSYAFRALVLSDDLRRGDLLSFIGRLPSDKFMTYGFLHSYLLSPVFVVLGPSFAVARTFSVFLMVGSGIMAFALCSALDRRAGPFAGLFVVAALVSSPEMIDWHTSNMLEPLAVLLSIACFGLYVLSRGSGRALPHVLTGLLLAAVFFTKHNYGVLAVAGIAADGLVSLASAVVHRQRAELRREIWSYLLLGCSAAVPVLVWVRVVSLERALATIRWELYGQWLETDLGNRSFGERLLDTLSMLRGAYFVAPAVGWYALLVLALSLIVIKERRLRALGIFAATALVLIPTSQWIQPRYLITAVPPLLIVVTLVPLRLLRAGGFHRLAAGFLLIGLAVGLLGSWPAVRALPDRIVATAEPAPGYVWREASGGGHPANLIDAIDFVRAQVPRERSVATMVRLGFLSPYVWRFEFHEWGAPVWTANEFDDPQMPTSDYFVALDFGAAFPYQEDIQSENRSTNSKLWSAYLVAREHEGSVVVDAQRDFPTIATKVLVYRNVGPTTIPLPAFLPPMKL